MFFLRKSFILKDFKMAKLTKFWYLIILNNSYSNKIIYSYICFIFSKLHKNTQYLYLSYLSWK